MITVYGIKSCDTVRKARKWLAAEGLDHEFVDFRQEGLELERAERWVAALGSKALRNTSGGAYRALPADKKEWTDAQWVKAFANEPMLVKRPVFERDGAPVRVGFKGTEDEIRATLSA